MEFEDYKIEGLISVDYLSIGDLIGLYQNGIKWYPSLKIKHLWRTRYGIVLSVSFIKKRRAYVIKTNLGKIIYSNNFGILKLN